MAVPVTTHERSKEANGCLAQGGTKGGVVEQFDAKPKTDGASRSFSDQSPSGTAALVEAGAPAAIGLGNDEVHCRGVADVGGDVVGEKFQGDKKHHTGGIVEHGKFSSSSPAVATSNSVTSATHEGGGTDQLPYQQESTVIESARGGNCDGEGERRSGKRSCPKKESRAAVTKDAHDERSSTSLPAPASTNTAAVDDVSFKFSSKERNLRRTRSFDGMLQCGRKTAGTGGQAGGRDKWAGQHALPSGGWAKDGLNHRTANHSGDAAGAVHACAASIGFPGENGRWHQGIGVVGVEGDCGVEDGRGSGSGPTTADLFKDDGLKEAFAARGRHKKHPVKAR